MRLGNTASEVRGFTLVELIVVIVIIGILAVTAAPRFIGNQSGTDLATTEARLISLLRLEQQRAMQDTAQRCYGVSITATTIAPANPGSCGLTVPPERIIALSGLTVTAVPGAWSGGLLFNSHGCPVTLAHASTSEACGSDSVQLQLSAGGDARFVCIQAQGYIRSGACT